MAALAPGSVLRPWPRRSVSELALFGIEVEFRYPEPGELLAELKREAFVARNTSHRKEGSRSKRFGKGEGAGPEDVSVHVGMGFRGRNADRH